MDWGAGELECGTLPKFLACEILAVVGMDRSACEEVTLGYGASRQ